MPPNEKIDSDDVHIHPMESDPLLPNNISNENKNGVTNSPEQDGEGPTLHRRVSTWAQDVTAQIFEDLQAVTEDLQQNVEEEVQDLKDMALEELHQPEEQNVQFLDFALTRNVSILPNDLHQAVDHWNQQEQQKQSSEAGPSELSSITDVEQDNRHNEQKVESTSTIPISAYIGLASAVISLSSIGPLLELETQLSPTMKITWRMFGTSLLMFPFAVRDMFQQKNGGINQILNLTCPQWTTFFLSTISYTTMSLCFILSLPYTALGNAVILANSQAIMLLAGNLFVGKPVTLLEGGGAIIAFTGAVLCSKDSADDGNKGTGTWTTLWGDFLALLAGLGGCGYLIFAKTSRLHIKSLFVFTFLTMFFGSIFCVILQVTVLGETVTYDMDRSTGVFGFLSPDRLPLELAIVVICNCMGTIGYVRAMQYFDSLIISVAGLMEPVGRILRFCHGCVITSWLVRMARKCVSRWWNSYGGMAQ